MRIGILAGIVCAVTAGCYSPGYRDCEVTCASGSCPAGLECVLGSCRTPGFSGVCNPNPPDDGRQPDTDDAPDAPVDSGNGCGWTMSPSNVDACAIPVAITDWILSNTTYSTSTGGTVPGQLVTQPNGDTVRVVHAQTVTFSGTVTITGTYPLVILADTVSFPSGVISVVAGRNPPECTPINGVTATYCGTGGPGASFGGQGGAGASCEGAGAVVSPTTGTGDQTLIPLRGGCNGAAGGGPGNTTKGGGGPGGGALQISARLSMMLSGTIFANGGGGGGGAGDGGNVCGGTAGCASGGGGGGSGGALLLEAPGLTLASTGQLCLTGGGGGGGGTNASGTFATSGGSGTCSGGGTGGPGNSGLSNGGPGGGAGSPSATDGASQNDVNGGGGGGGAAGRIRVRTMSAGWKQSGAVVLPTPYEG